MRGTFWKVFCAIWKVLGNLILLIVSFQIKYISVLKELIDAKRE
jgi:hypothetical protein